MTLLRTGILVAMGLAPLVFASHCFADGEREPLVLKKPVKERRPVVRLYKPAPSCHHAPETFATYDRQNSFNHGFGCASQSTFDKMLANRRDKYAGRGTPYSDGERAAYIVTNYRVWKGGDPPPSQDPRSSPAE